MSAPLLAIGALAAIGLIALSRSARGASSGVYNTSIAWIPSPNFTHADRKRGDVRLIVIHTAEAPKTDHTAHDVAANWAALPASGVSAHYAVDSDHVVAMVHEPDIAWHARSANGFSIGIEHAGSAAQSAAQWGDSYNDRLLARSAALTRAIAARWGIPLVWLTAAEVRAGKSGITGHRECTDAFEGGQGHGDPGPNFPRAEYIQRVRSA